MSDLRLRELERRWRQTDAVEDEVAYLGERVRLGDLHPDRLRLAAWLGHPAAERLAELRFEPSTPRARDAVAGLVQAPDSVQGALSRWGDGLIAFGQDVALRAALADARRCLRAIHAAMEQGPRRGRVEDGERTWLRVMTVAVDAALRAVIADGPAHREAARDALRRRTDARLLSWSPLGPSAESRQAWTDLFRVAWALARGMDGQPIDAWWASTRTDDAVDALARYHALRGAVKDEVLPWALGWRDPLADQPARALESLDRVDALDVASPCHAAWDDMPLAEPRGRARACAACQHVVYDVSAMTRAEVEELLREREGQRLCVRFYRRDDGRVVTRDCPVGLEARVDRAAIRPRPFMGIRAR